MAELTATGLSIKRLIDYVTELDAGYRAIFGDNIDIDADSPDGQIIGIISEAFSNLEQALEDVYNAFDPAASAGASLSKLVPLNGITRQDATESTATITLTGTAATVIAAGASFSTSDTGEAFLLDAEATIGGGGTVNAAVTAETAGATAAVAGTITVIDTPVVGLVSVTNAADATEGTDEETDSELRIRRENSVAAPGTSAVDSIFAAIAALDGVTDVKVLENATASLIQSLVILSFDADFVTGNTIDITINGVAMSQVTFATSHANTITLIDSALTALSDVALVAEADDSPGSTFNITGDSDTTIVIDSVVVASGASQAVDSQITQQVAIEAHGIHAVVLGGTAQDIIDAIFESKPAGTPTTGIESGSAEDTQGETHTINYSEPTEVDIDVVVSVTTDGDFPSTGSDDIKAAIVAFGATFEIGDDVEFSRLYTPINSVPGHFVTALTIARSGESGATSNIVLANNELAVFTTGNITVNVT